MDAIVNWYMSTIGTHIPRELSVFIISMCPILELRGGLIVARLLDLPMWRAICLCVVGNIIPIPFVLLFIKQILKWLKKIPGLGKVAQKIEDRAMKKKDGVEKAEFWGLVAFVGIPLPGTGAWTGSLVASLLDVKIKKAVVAELLGICIATVIMSLLMYGLVGNVIS